jgi:tRNA (cytidine/uridine-2'-O-)-methyltransferase
LDTGRLEVVEDHERERLLRSVLGAVLRDGVNQFIVLVHPEIPPNTGNIIRLAANTGCTLHLVEPLGFSMDDKLLRRAGLDYHEHAAVRRHASWAALLQTEAPDPSRCFAFTTRGATALADIGWQPGDWLVFGSETAGLPPEIRDSFADDRRVRLPMRAGQRSLNLSNAVAVVVFEAWRQTGYTFVKRESQEAVGWMALGRDASPLTAANR